MVAPARAAVGSRISVIGTSGSGKTQTSALLAQRLAVPHVELDALYWGPNWTATPLPMFRERVAQALQGPRWVCDGNYSRVRDIVWSRADTVVWLDYPLPIVMWQLVSRTIRRASNREELWHGNRESLCSAFFSHDSILLWAVRTYGRRRRQYPALLQSPAHAHLGAVHLTSPSVTREWLDQIVPAANPM
jgi:hypothetical protein